MPTRRHRYRLARLKRKNALKPPGTAPATLVADPEAMKPVISVMVFGQQHCEQITGASIADVVKAKTQGPRVWVNVDGLGDAELVRQLGEIFDLHPLALEDVLNPAQRAKVDFFDEHVFIVMREPMPCAHPSSHFDTDQISIFMGKDFAITFQEKAGDCFEPVRDRLRKGRGKVRVGGPAYLVYCLIDSIVDAYFPILENYGEQLENIEDRAVEKPTLSIVHEIHEIKRELLLIRRSLWPTREAIGQLSRDESSLIDNESRLYLRDVYDHLVQLIDILENYRELGADLMDIYLSSQSNRLNEVMKVLTIIATIFMPLSFIAGVYGMNFDTSHPANMPELHWKYGYIYSLTLMGVIGFGMLWWFWRRGWIGTWKHQHTARKSDAEK